MDGRSQEYGTVCASGGVGGYVWAWLGSLWGELGFLSVCRTFGVKVEVFTYCAETGGGEVSGL